MSSTSAPPRPMTRTPGRHRCWPHSPRAAWPRPPGHWPSSTPLAASGSTPSRRASSSRRRTRRKATKGSATSSPARARRPGQRHRGRHLVPGGIAVCHRPRSCMSTAARSPVTRPAGPVAKRRRRLAPFPTGADGELGEYVARQLVAALHQQLQHDVDQVGRFVLPTSGLLDRVGGDLPRPRRVAHLLAARPTRMRCRSAARAEAYTGATCPGSRRSRRMCPTTSAGTSSNTGK